MHENMHCPAAIGMGACTTKYERNILLFTLNYTKTCCYFADIFCQLE
jgi:hypothetical protein